MRHSSWRKLALIQATRIDRSFDCETALRSLEKHRLASRIVRIGALSTRSASVWLGYWLEVSRYNW